MARDLSSDATVEAALALHRFGLGPRPGSIAAIASDPRGALLAELERPGIGRIVNPELLTSAQSSRFAFEARAERQAQTTVTERAKKEAEQRAQDLAKDQAMNPAMSGEMAPAADAANATKPADAAKASQAADAAKPVQAADAANATKPADAANPVAMADAEKPAAPPPTPERQNFLKEVRARLDAAFDAEVGFVERLVWFWSNHFCVSAYVVPNMAGGYEREAIRPHILGRFADMLLAAESHPAMLFYLDNAMSFGPHSVAGINRTRGLNENLAREILELHTLGVRTGYSQDDVIRFANVLTGWTIISVRDNPEHGAEFIFNRRLHEPGPQEVIGKTYPDTGVEQGRAVLADLARHPATATHVATKLVRHFIADVPPPALVERLARTFRDTEGDLKEVAKALITSEEAWAAPRDKLKTPSEWVVAMTRATGLRGDADRFERGQALLGQPVWAPSAPQGFPDDEATWIGGMGRRLDIANNVAGRLAQRVDLGGIIDTALGALAGSETRQAVARAESREQALALAFMSPEFQRR
jgi:uncharacterized protein (DUF1800 family)